MIARPLKLNVEQAALGIHRIMNSQVSEGIRLVSIRQGYDPRKFTLLPLGGGGALHACALAEELGIASILVPRHPGVLSASGLLAAPIEHEVSTGLTRNIDAIDLAEIQATLQRLDAQCGALMTQENVPAGDVSRRYFADICYVGQGYHLEVAFEPDASDPLATLAAAFYAAHERTFGFARRAPLRLVALRTVHSAAAAAEPEEKWLPARGASGPRRARILLCEHQGAIEAAVHDRAGLESGAMFNGPAIVEQADTTTLVLPGWRARVDGLGNLVLDRL
jgi:N-methylhydantoinase A